MDWGSEKCSAARLKDWGSEKCSAARLKDITALHLFHPNRLTSNYTCTRTEEPQPVTPPPLMYSCRPSPHICETNPREWDEHHEVLSSIVMKRGERVLGVILEEHRA